MSDKLRVSVLTEKILDSGAKIPLPESVHSYQFINGELDDGFIIDNTVSDTQVTPVAIDISQFTGINAVLIRGSYVDADPVNGISSGDPAKIQVRFNGTGIWMELEELNLLGFTPTQIEIKVQGTKKIKVGRTISAT
ncbi:MAG: hypothetical protein HS129_04950 [Leptospiraceae bacterium]|nr:hypothetical protein [Leptospiraceae bacterium]